MEFPKFHLNDFGRELLVILAIIVAVTLVGIFTWTPPARAHGEAHWIESNPNFIARNTTSMHCCGERDCRREPSTSFRENKDGTVTYLPTNTTFEPRKNGYYHSKDEDWWVCDNKWAMFNGKPSIAYCIFKPFGGM